MSSCHSQSFFQDLSSRELNGFRVRKMPYISDDRPEYNQIGTVAVDHEGITTPPMSVSFCKTNKYSHVLAVSDEEGYISLYNTHMKLPSSSTHQENTGKSRFREWIAHDNAIFDICWIKEDTTLLSASGDQSIKVWDVEELICTRALMGHTGSVKSISCHPTNHDIIVSGSRDGSFALWDLRSNESSHQKLSTSPIHTIHEAHTHPSRRRVRRGKAASMSITSVLYLKDEITIATAGAVDSVIKFWDTRNLKTPLLQASPQPDSSDDKERTSHGISWMSQDMNGVYISASCMDSRIYLYNVLQLDKGPVKTFSGCRIESFFVKSAISPDAAHILSGSSDGNAYIWKVQKPHADPVVLKGHDGEVTAVDWCPSDIGKVATSSDDFTVHLWNIQGSCYSNTRSPSSIRKRVTVHPTAQRRRLFADEEASRAEDAACISPAANHCVRNSPSCELSTPEAQKTKAFCSVVTEEATERTPEVEAGSPSSVLNPPSSVKRKTIRDYFLTAS